MKSIIELNKVTKMYGSVVGIKNVSLQVPAGTVYGFLGPNGAGKSTTINMLVDFLRPTSGSIKVFGVDSETGSMEIRRRIGFLAGDMAMDKGLTGWQQLEYFGNLRGNYDKKYVHELAERLDCKLNRKFRTLSRGNKQKVGLIAALMHKPELLILDEPTSGLDPLIQAEFNKIILDHRKAGNTVFISSHVLSEVQELCDKVAFIREGHVVAEKTLSELAASSPKEVQITTKDAKLKTALKKLKGFKQISDADSVIKGNFTGNVDELIKLLAKYKVINLHLHDAELEAVFMQYYEEKNA